MAKVGDKVLFTQANSPFAQAQQFEAEITSNDKNNVASLILTIPGAGQVPVDGIAMKQEGDAGDYPVWEHLS